MSSNHPKYAYTEQGLAVFCNSLNHENAVSDIFGEQPIKNKGFIKIKVVDGQLTAELHSIIGEGEINEVCENSPEIQKAVNDLLFCRENHTEYVLSFSRFALFPAKLFHKDVADHLFYDSIIKGAGNMVFVIKDGKPYIECYGQATSVEIEHEQQDIDAKILMDNFHIEHN